MKAAVWTGIDKVEIKELPEPVPQKEEVLLRIKSAGICATDIEIIKGEFKYAQPPHVLGHEIAGEIVELGSDVKGWKNGDRVVLETMVNCGDCFYCRRGMKHLCDIGGDIGYNPYQGGYAQYIAVPARCLYKIPDNVSFDEAGIVESFICPAGSIHRLGMHFGDTVLIQGAGPAGLAYVQVAKVCGAGKIIVAEKNDVRLKLADKFGADVVISVDKENIERRVMEETKGQGVDVSIDAAGNPSTVAYCTKLARKNGKIILYGIPADDDGINFPVTEIILKQLSIFGASGNPHVWQSVLDLMAKGVFDIKSMVTMTFPLEEFCKALDYVINNKSGVVKVVINP